MSKQIIERLTGYYWVKYKGNWIICKWIYLHQYWLSVGQDDKFNDSKFDEISNTPITFKKPS